MSDLEMAVKHMAQHIADRSNPPGPAAASGATEIRRLAAERAVNDGNKRANLPGHAPPNTKLKNVSPAKKRKGDKNKAKVEGTPPFAKQGLSGDGWTKASEKASEMYQAVK